MFFVRRFHWGHLLLAILLAGGTAAGGTAVATRPPPPAGATCQLRAQNLPDPICTPGATNPNVSPANIQSTICLGGFTRTIRPAASYTDNLKRHQIAQYGFADQNPRSYEEDHLIPLELGGHPSSPANLWPQPYSPSPGAHQKDLVENAAHAAVCSGQIALANAQADIAQNWILLGHSLGVL